MKTILPSKKIFLTIIILSILMGSFYFGSEIFWNKEKTISDSTKYFEISDYFNGKNNNFLENSKDNIFQTRVLLPLLAYPFTKIMSNNNAFGLVNLIFLILTSLMTWILTQRIFRKKSISDVASIMFVISLPIIAYATRPLTDMISYFFFVTILYISLIMNYHKTKDYIILGIVLIFAFLHKETAFFVLIPFAIFILLNRRMKWREKIRNGTLLGITTIIGLIPTMIWQWFSKTSWLARRGGFFIFNKGFIWLPFILLVVMPAITFHILYLPIAYGIKKLQKSKYKELLVISIPCLITVILGWLFASPPFSPRIIFFMFPVFLPIASYGLHKFTKNKKHIYYFVGIYGLISLIGALLFPSVPVANWSAILPHNLIKTGIESFIIRWGF